MEVSYLNAAVAVRLDRAAATPKTAPFLAAANPDGSLPKAEEEVEQILKCLPPGRRELRIGTKSAADVGWLTRSLQAFAPAPGILHLATHGQLAENAWDSNLTFAGGPLTLRDVASRLRGLLRGWLVVLSACESARPRETPGVATPLGGGELLSLARSFAQAGAGTLVASLWKVDDRATSQSMTAFYKQMLAGAAPGTALTAAKKQLRKTFPDPYYWAPFVLIGRSW
ncbi:MAG: CHAT domain-containing protein [Candidatus Wallbacteria bacterium]|nr:CHAT domain-containing protein [Candidatus Wallbacteria bacterium]